MKNKNCDEKCSSMPYFLLNNRALERNGSFCKYRRAWYLYCFRPFVVRSCLELFCFLSFVSFVLRHLCSGSHRRNLRNSDETDVYTIILHKCASIPSTPRNLLPRRELNFSRDRELLYFRTLTISDGMITLEYVIVGFLQKVKKDSVMRVGFPDVTHSNRLNKDTQL